jgi:hypothetical protein
MQKSRSYSRPSLPAVWYGLGLRGRISKNGCIAFYFWIPITALTSILRIGCISRSVMWLQGGRYWNASQTICFLPVQCTDELTKQTPWSWALSEKPPLVELLKNS